MTPTPDPGALKTSLLDSHNGPVLSPGLGPTHTPGDENARFLCYVPCFVEWNLCLAWEWEPSSMGHGQGTQEPSGVGGHRA